MIWTSNNKLSSKLPQKQAHPNWSMGKHCRVARAPVPGPGLASRFPLTAALTTKGCGSRSNCRTMAM